MAMVPATAKVRAAGFKFRARVMVSPHLGTTVDAAVSGLESMVLLVLIRRIPYPLDPLVGFGATDVPVGASS
jgi:hypothetical protein